MGRRAECGALDRLLEAVRLGKSQVLVVRGEPGVGKTALLDYLVERASACRVIRAAGVESEMELAFAGLHQLCVPLLELDAALPGAQRDVLRTALGLSAGPAPDQFLVGLAVLGLMAEAAGERPLMCVVDDAQWLDHASAQALAFVARRLVAESVALVFATRGCDEMAVLAGFAQLEVEGLPEVEARALLGSVLRGPIDERVLERVVAESRGNPLALLELPRGVTVAEFSGGFGVGRSPVAAGIEDSYRRQLAALPADTRRLLLVAAAEPVGDPVLLWRAAEMLEIGLQAAAPAAEAGLLEIGNQVRLRHPLLRSTIYRMASAGDRREAHGALAEATDPEADPARRAWHRAQAAPEPNEDVACELERLAERAQACGGLAAAAAFLRRSTGLTPGPVDRTRRALAAARATHLSGAPDTALHLLAIAAAGPLDKLQRAQTDLLRGQLAFTVDQPGKAAALLLHAATQLEPLDPSLARDTYRDAYTAALQAGRRAGELNLVEVARAVRGAPPASQPPAATDLLLDAMALLVTEGYAAAAPLVKQALHAFGGEAMPAHQELYWLPLACRAANVIWDFDGWRALSTRFVQLARDQGALSVFPMALATVLGTKLLGGEFAEAASLVEERQEIIAAVGIESSPAAALMLAAWQGREAEASRLLRAAQPVSRGEGLWVASVSWASAVLHNGLGRYEEAFDAAEQAVAAPLELGVLMRAEAELIEAASRCGRAEHAVDALARLEESTSAGDTDWGLAIQARCRALCSEGPAAESLYQEAIERLTHSGVRSELARAHLLYGEWLRRQQRRMDAREQLRTAHEMFGAMGMDAFGQRAARELRVTGQTVRKRGVETATDLTAQETQIVRFVRDGLSNPEIAARLFLSTRTVEWHLSKIFAKLQITSRAQLFARAQG
jgi:DNA-binding CsgD family transcriptional regulator/tetratricopeptide (TPR) repeat protein